MAFPEDGAACAGDATQTPGLVFPAFGRRRLRVGEGASPLLLLESRGVVSEPHYRRKFKSLLR